MLSLCTNFGSDCNWWHAESCGHCQSGRQISDAGRDRCHRTTWCCSMNGSCVEGVCAALNTACMCAQTCVAHWGCNLRTPGYRPAKSKWLSLDGHEVRRNGFAKKAHLSAHGLGAGVAAAAAAAGGCRMLAAVGPQPGQHDNPGERERAKENGCHDHHVSLCITNGCSASGMHELQRRGVTCSRLGCHP